MAIRKSRKMKNIITRIAKKNGFNLDATKINVLEIKNHPFMSLIIETLGDNSISIAHYYEQNGDLIPDPEIVFFVAPDGEWYPIETSQTFGYKRLIEFENGFYTCKYPRKQRETAAFANYWADNLLHQGFVKLANESIEWIRRLNNEHPNS